MQLNGRTVLITGGTGGLGAALSKELSTQGANVITVGIDARETLRVDLSDSADVAQLCHAMANQPIDILIHNAGLQYFGRFHEQPEGLLQAMIAVNLHTPLMLTKALLPGMLARGSGQIVVIGSGLAAVPFGHFETYCATKAGMRAFSQSLRREYGARGIVVTYAAPRAMSTSMSTGRIAEFLKRTHSATDDPATAAKAIVRAMVRDKREITIGFGETMFGRLSPIAPSLFDAALGKHAAIAEEILSASSF